MVSCIPSLLLQGILALIGTGPFILHFRANVKFSCVLWGFPYLCSCFGIDCMARSAQVYAFGACGDSDICCERIHSQRERASNRRALCLMDFSLMPLQVMSPGETPSTKSTIQYWLCFFFCLLKSNELTIKAFCKISSKHAYACAC